MGTVGQDEDVEFPDPPKAKVVCQEQCYPSDEFLPPEQRTKPVLGNKHETYEDAELLPIEDLR